MANIPQPPEEEKESEATGEKEGEDGEEKQQTEDASEIEEEQGSPIVNEVEADSN